MPLIRIVCDDLSEWRCVFIKVYAPQSVIEHIIVESAKKLQFMANFSFFYFHFVPKKTHCAIFLLPFDGFHFFCFILMDVRSFWRHQPKKFRHQRSSVAVVCIQSFGLAALFFASIKHYFIILILSFLNTVGNCGRWFEIRIWIRINRIENQVGNMLLLKASALSCIRVNHKFWQCTHSRIHSTWNHYWFAAAEETWLLSEWKATRSLENQ